MINIKFMGTREETKGAGCKVCAARKKRQGKLVFQRYFTLPSGDYRNFVKGKTYQVNDDDAEHLLLLTYNDRGRMRKMFEVVE